ncbi:hypothetical protein OEZ85_006065 [Tetradesmus obliquus]|uniref:Uncharacterized protein n=1 Tax=Tetradesmus obliquus TaxID=3088 RepID=A0ABY8UKS3_TETOB|nr:hypothetical protein OEZ85_006065 [Tetradesmus obliquus]
MPNMVLQLVLAAMQAAPGSLFISIYEAGSTDATTYWLDVLRLLLLPLRVPAAITTGGSIPASADSLSKFPLYYGDAAVGRLVTGRPFDVVPKFAGAHPPTVRCMAAGLPVQVYCCWSGLAKVRAEPFRRGLRFRAQQPGECSTTSDSASLLCDDLHRLGFSRALVDAGVLVTPQLEVSAQLSNTVKQANRMPYVRRSRWVEVQGAGSPWQLSGEELARKATLLTVPLVAAAAAQGSM